MPSFADRDGSCAVVGRCLCANPRRPEHGERRRLAGELLQLHQATGTVTVNVPGGPHLTIWKPTRPLRLLDLTGLWPIRNGASLVIASGPHSVCRAWSHAIACHPVRVDGLLYTSTMTAGPAAALFRPSADAYPAHPSLSMPLGHPGLVGAVRAAARRIGYGWD